MSDLLGAASRIDDVSRSIDQFLTTPGSRLDARSLGLDRLTSDLSLQLGAAMPTQLGAEASRLHAPWDNNFVTLATTRAQLAELGAVTRAVHELGGVDHVISQGGLDAIDGAADVIRRHLLLDAKDQLRTARAIVDERPFGISMSRTRRDEHVDAVRRAVTAPMTQLERAGLVDGATAINTRLWDVLSAAGSNKAAYEGVLDEVGRALDDVDSMAAGDMPVSTEAWRSHMLTSNRARSIAGEQAARSTLPTAPRLATLADDAAVLANARPALDQHEATFDALLVAVGDGRYHDAEYTAAMKAALPKLQRANEDLARIEQLVANSSDRVRDAAYVARDWVAFAAGQAATPSREFHGSQQQALPTALANIRALRDQLAPVIDEPDLLRASTDVAEELQEVLARPGARMDLDVIRSLLDGDSGRSARIAFVEHLPTSKPHPADAPRTSDPREAIALLDEASSIGSALSSAINKGRWVEAQRMLDEPGLLEATDQLLARADTALGTTQLVTEQIARSLEQNVTSMRERVHHVTTDSWAKPDHYALNSLTSAITAFRDELATVSARADADGGLRAISPSARPAQAAEARSRWLIRELDSLTAPASDASSDVHIDDAARRATIVRDLLRVSGSAKGDGARNPLVDRAITEYQSLGETWRMPDDVAFDLAHVRDEIRRTGTLHLAKQLNTMFPGYNTNPGMLRAERIASGLQAWSMFTDGPLPATAADRLSVAARRGAAVREELQSLASLSDHDRAKLRIGDLAQEMRVRIAAVEEIADGADLAPHRAGLDAMLGKLDGEIERQAAKRSTFDKPGAPPVEVFDGAPLDAWITALEDAHRTARTTATEQLAW